MAYSGLQGRSGVACAPEAEHSQTVVEQGSGSQQSLLAFAKFTFSHFDENHAERAVFKNKLFHFDTRESALQGLRKNIGFKESIYFMFDLESALLVEKKPRIWSKPQPMIEANILTRQERIFFVQDRAGSSDVELPTPRVDLKNEEISIEWKKLFTGLFGQLASLKVKRFVRLNHRRSWPRQSSS